ncbi:MAG TPA: DoxX family protein [Balneolaceae bacterium]|nr:DoxX family protein [Balneolaceae bacterium]
MSSNLQNNIWKQFLKTNTHISTTILRVTLGLIMLPHSLQKMFGWFGGNGFAGTMNYFTGFLGIPEFLAFLAIVTEFVGALALIAGLVTRLWAFGISILMATAMFMIHFQNGFFINWSGQQAGEGIEFHLLVIGITIVLMILGGGKWSLDNRLTAKLKPAK